MGVKLLLVDDSPTIAKILSLALAQENYAIRSVENAHDAQKELERDVPDLFLIDIGLPEKDGYAFSREIRRTASLRHVRIVLLASSLEPIDNKKCQECGADAVIAKPFNPVELRQKLKEVLAKKNHQNRGQSPPAASVAPSPKIAAPSTPITSGTEETLSPAARELAAFLESQIQLQPEAITAPEPRATASASSAGKEPLLESPPSLDERPLATKAPTLQLDTSAAEEVLDLSDALMDWTPKDAGQRPSLQNWSASKPSGTMFDTGNSTFRFSPDYAERITRALEPDGSQSSPILSKSSSPTIPAQDQYGAKEEKSSIAPSGATPFAAPPPPAQTLLSRQEMEEIIRDEVRLVCKAVVEKISWEIVPELAENVIRQELEKVLKEIDASKGS